MWNLINVLMKEKPGPAPAVSQRISILRGCACPFPQAVFALAVSCPRTAEESRRTLWLLPLAKGPRANGRPCPFLCSRKNTSHGNSAWAQLLRNIHNILILSNSFPFSAIFLHFFPFCLLFSICTCGSCLIKATLQDNCKKNITKCQILNTIACWLSIS